MTLPAYCLVNRRSSLSHVHHLFPPSPAHRYTRNLVNTKQLYEEHLGDNGGLVVSTRMVVLKVEFSQCKIR